MVSLKLDAPHHPIQGDTLGSLVVDGTRAATRRANVAWPMKLLYISWFWVMALAPTRVAHRAAVLFLFPERRGSFNRVLARLHTRQGSRGT